ncbi:patatin-like phospholipase family protein [Marinobacterium aestuariivivens]|uniref:Patatin-like phospholipase family protein n=1 Tax=Marinobacterium aestuariivivens TaxID=1698799 RepID=A0ABW2A7T7_9GAMM
MKVTVSLALGSGGARGYAHIGVIEELERRGYRIKAIAGSSMGALVGGSMPPGCWTTIVTGCAASNASISSG